LIAVMGASGHTGGRVAEKLIEAGEKVRVLGRSADKLERFENDGADVQTVDATDAAALTKAFRGANAVFTLLPPDFRSTDFRALQDRIGEATVKAVQDSGVERVVLLSSLGAEFPEGTGPIAGLHAQEERLRKLEDVHVLSLRAGYFFENSYRTLGLVRQQGINGGAVAPDVPIAMIATRDIGDAAAKALHQRDFEGFVVRELLGERDLTLADATRILGAAIGKPDLKYVQFPRADFVKALVSMGASQNVASLYGEMADALSKGRVKSLEGRRPENTTPTSFEQFVPELAKAYQAMS
jgi:uncharacterized protein YbjT (DUF2867 family)